MNSNTRYKCPIGPQFSLISKDIEIKPLSIYKQPLIIGITGPTKSGKTAIAKQLVTEEGFYFYSMIRPVKEMASNLGKTDVDWKELGELAVLLRKNTNTTILANYFIDYYYRNLRDVENIVVDGILHNDEVVEFRNTFNNFFLFYIFPKNERIRTRYVKTNKLFEPNSDLRRRDKFEQFTIQDNDPYRPNILKCKELSFSEIGIDGYNWPDINNGANEILELVYRRK